MSKFDIDEEFHSCDEDEYIDSKLEKLDDIAEAKFKNITYTSYFIKNGRDFIKLIRPWTFNNPLNDEHIEKIFQQLKKEPFLTGVFTVLCLEDKSLVLIDGHHRYHALMQLYQEGFDDTIFLEVHCYQSDRIESDRTISLFSKLNNTKPFQPDLPIIIMTINIIKKLKDLFPNVIKSGKTRANFPNILEEELNDLLQNKLKKIKLPLENRIIKKIINLNNEYKNIAKSIISSNKKRNWEKSKIRLERTGCYLGIVPINEWINKLE